MKLHASVAGVAAQASLLLLLTGPVAAAACRAALEGGLVINAPRPDVLRFAPSLLVSEAQIDGALAILGPVLAQLTSAGDAAGQGDDHG